MNLFFFQSENGDWHVDISTYQSLMPAVLNDYIKDAVLDAMDKFNKI